MANNFTGLKWVDNPNYTFGGTVKSKAAFKKGKFTRQGVLQYMTQMSDDLKKKKKEVN